MDWKNVIVKMNGEEIKSISTIKYNIHKKCSYPVMEYYYRNGKRYYFRNKIGIKLIITSDNEVYNHMKYGQVFDMNIN